MDSNVDLMRDLFGDINELDNSVSLIGVNVNDFWMSKVIIDNNVVCLNSLDTDYENYIIRGTEKVLILPINNSEEINNINKAIKKELKCRLSGVSFNGEELVIYGLKLLFNYADRSSYGNCFISGLFSTNTTASFKLVYLDGNYFLIVARGFTVRFGSINNYSLSFAIGYNNVMEITNDGKITKIGRKAKEYESKLLEF